MSRGDLILLVEQQQALLANLVTARDETKPRWQGCGRLRCAPARPCPTLVGGRRRPQHTLSKPIAQCLGELLTVVRVPVIPPDNYAAERGLRHLVTSREISGGYRSADGTATKMALATLFRTWRTQGANPYLACRHNLSPPV